MQAVKPSCVSKEESMVLVKNMIRISISSICFFRDLFPDDCYKTKQYGAIEIHQLQGAKKCDNGEFQVTNEEAFLITQWLEKGVFAALETEYLSSMTFAIFKRNSLTGCDTLLETYEFKFTYTASNNVSLNGVELNSKEVVKGQAAKLIRSLTEFTATLTDLPFERWLTIELKYNENAPQTYEPEYFSASSTGLGSKTFPLVVNIGQIRTPELELKLKFSGFETFLEEDLVPETITSPVKPTATILQGSVYAKSVEKPAIMPSIPEKPLVEPIPMETFVEETENQTEVNKEKDVTSLVLSYIEAHGLATPKKIASFLKITETAASESCRSLLERKDVYLKGKSTYVLTPKKKEQSEERKKPEPEVKEQIQNKSSSNPHTNVVEIETYQPQEQIMLSQTSEQRDLRRKFSVITDPVQVFQDHKRKRK